MKKLTIEITDIHALEAAYPAIVETIPITKKVADRSKLREIAKAAHLLGQTIPGVKAYYAGEEAAADDTPPSSVAHQ